MDDENDIGVDKDDIVEGEEKGEGGEGDAFEGEALILKSMIESKTSLVSDFCKDEDFKGGVEYGGEPEWVCQELEEVGEYFRDEFPYRDEMTVEEEQEREKITVEEKRSLDSEYLKAVLGAPLTYALLDIASRRPTDPIQYLGHFLVRWRWCRENKERYEKRTKELTEERQAHMDRLKEKERQEMLRKEQEEEELRRAERVESSIEDDFGETVDFVDE